MKMNAYLERLLLDFPAEAIFYDGKYFQVKSYGEELYALEISEPGPCGDKTPHPLLKFTYQGNNIGYRYFADFVVNPIMMVYATEENLPFFQENMLKILSLFKNVFPEE